MGTDSSAKKESDTAGDTDSERRTPDSEANRTGTNSDGKSESTNSPTTYENDLPTTFRHPDAFFRQLKTDLSRLGLSDQTTRADIALYPPRVHGVAAGTAIVTTAILFLVAAPLLAQFNLLPLSAPAYLGQFTARTWAILLGASLFATIGSAIFWYTHSAPPWLTDYIQTGDVIVTAVVVGIMFLAVPGVIGYYLSIRAGFLLLLLAIGTMSYVTHFELVPYPQFQQIVRTALSIDESLSATDFDMLGQHGFTIPHRRATARHLTTDDGVGPDQEGVLTLNPDDHAVTFAPGYYRAVASMADTLAEIETVQGTAGPLTRGVAAVIAEADPSRLSAHRDCESAAALADAGAQSIDYYVELLDSGYAVDAQRFADLIDAAQQSICRNTPPEGEDLETATACFRDLAKSLDIVARIDTVRETWATQTNFDLDAIISLPSDPGRIGSALLALEPRVSRAESLVPLATQLSEFCSRNNQPAAETLGDAVESYVRRELTGSGGGQPNQQVVESALTVGETALGLTESHPEAPFGNLVRHVARRIRSGKLSQAEVQEVEDTIDFADRILGELSQLRVTADRKVIVSFVGEIRRHVANHLSSPTDPRLNREILEAAVRISQSTLDLAREHPEYPFDGSIRFLTEQLSEDSLSTDDLTSVETTLNRAEQLLRGLDDLNTSHPSVPADEWESTLRDALLNISPQRLEDPLEELERLRQLRDGFWDREDMMSYSPEEFEQVVAALYEAKGYDTSVSEYSNDLGVDVWANRDSDTVAVQVKQYSRGNTVGREALQKTVSSIAKGDADQAAVVTSSSFASTAEDYAEDFGPRLTLIDDEELLQQLSESNVLPPKF